MAFYSYPFESQNTGTPEQPVYDRAITAENERQFNKLRYTNGVFIESSLDDDLQVIPGNGMAVKVSKGGCHIEGALAYNDNVVTLSLEAANATLKRIDRIVARFNTSTSVRSIMVYVKTGTNATNPVAPALQRESNFWEIGLADITIPAGATSISASNILDTRMDDSLCGRVLPAIPYITQLGSLYEQYQELVSSALSGTVAGQLEARISAEENKVQPVNKGGTGAITAADARKNMGVKKCGEYDTLPIAQGGTGKTTAADALAALGGASFKKLWENAKPSNAFVKQTISIALSGYDAVMIENCLFNNYTDRRIAQMFLVGKEGYMSQALQYIVWRMISIKSTGISFEQGQSTYQFNATSTDNTACIPTRIWGVKF